MRARSFAGVLASLTALLISTAVGAQRASDLSVISQVALERGVVTCLKSIEMLTVALGADYKLGAYFFNQMDRPDDGLVSISMELSPSRSGSPIYLSASFVSVAGACQAMVETTIYWDSSCETVGLAYPGYKAESKLLTEIDILASTGTERLFLVPTLRKSCISIEKAVYF